MSIFHENLASDAIQHKTGARIAIIADCNVAGQPSMLWRLLNKHTEHCARLIVAHDDYLRYDADIVLTDGGEARAQEVIAEADFFHIVRSPIYACATFPALNSRLKPNNSIVQYFGSEIRCNQPAMVAWHAQTGVLGVSAWDWTMLRGTPFLYHIPLMFDAEQVEPVSLDGVVRIAHAPTSREFKRTDIILKALEEIGRRHQVEVDLIEGVSNRECLARKQRCHITVDQVSVGIYGLNALESMAAQHAVLCGMSNFANSVYPDHPVVSVTEETLVPQLDALVRDPLLRAHYGARSRQWVKQHHDPKRVLPRYTWLYDLVRHGHRLV